MPMCTNMQAHTLCTLTPTHLHHTGAHMHTYIQVIVCTGWLAKRVPEQDVVLRGGALALMAVHREVL